MSSTVSPALAQGLSAREERLRRELEAVGQDPRVAKLEEELEAAGERIAALIAGLQATVQQVRAGELPGAPSDGDPLYHAIAVLKSFGAAVPRGEDDLALILNGALLPAHDAL